jgi:Amt family ammonium transporter
VHGVCGIWGVQALGALTIAAFTAVCGLILFYVLNKAKMLRVVRDAELFGIDIALHKTYAYPEEMADQQFGR